MNHTAQTVLAANAPWPFSVVQRTETMQRLARSAPAPRLSSPVPPHAAPSAFDLAEALAASIDLAGPDGQVSGVLWDRAVYLERVTAAEPEESLAQAFKWHVFYDVDEPLSSEETGMLLMFTALWVQDMGL